MSELFCCFCAGPLDDAKLGWINMLTEPCETSEWPPGDGKWHNDPGYPVPTKPFNEIVTLTAEDVKAWKDWVFVSPLWPETYVSSPPSYDPDGNVLIEGAEDWNEGDQPYLSIHRICLSFLCRRNAITPGKLWKAVFGRGSSYDSDELQDFQGLIPNFEYYDMNTRNSESYSYAVRRFDPPENRPDLPETEWLDPESMEDTKWLLTRPTELPAPKLLDTSSVKQSTISGRKVFEVRELFDLILTHIVDTPTGVIRDYEGDGGSDDSDDEENDGDGEDGDKDEEEDGDGDGDGEESGEKGDGDEQTQEDQGEVDEGDDEDEDGTGGEDEDAEEQQESDLGFDPNSSVTAAQTLLTLAQVDRWFYHAVRARQSTFLRIVRNFGWMLPCTPADWAHSQWPEELLTGDLTKLDWQSYMLACLRKETHSIRNRWRFHKMAVQFAESDRLRSAGKVGLESSIEKPERFSWEVVPLEVAEAPPPSYRQINVFSFDENLCIQV
ncbi:hypothetical protein AAF712_007400 [Marasmius tenuissimus]|uniref:Uncharacterized protein n=1 Tax=Marasmius tenuissimus TaxID=585030 RepID=A0ABR2ZZ92_9AGAR